jgi:multidrug efflux pump subunit AcrA (membrane-fusion protein)
VNCRTFATALGAFVLAACGGGAVDTQNAAVVDTVDVTGELRSSRSYFFGPPAVPNMWNYTIAYMAPDGEPVETATVILRFDTQELVTQLRSKENALNEKQTGLQRTRIVGQESLAELRLAVEEARAALDKAKLKAEIPKSLLAHRDYQENKLRLQESELDFAQKKAELAQEEIIQQTEIQILQREVNVLQIEVARLESSIESLTVKAPAAGVVIHATDRRQSKLVVGDNVWMGRRVLELPDLGLLHAYMEIPERESARLNLGQRVEFSLDAAPDRVFYGELVELASVVHTRSINQPEKVFDATALIRNADPDLMRPGMSIRAKIHVGDAQMVRR